MVDTLATAQHFIFVTQVYFCAMYAVVIWDWVISLPREWRFIWQTRWTPVKVAYLFCRYWVIAVVPYLLYMFVVDHPLETCERLFRIPVALAMWNQVGSESVLLIRTYAFFNRNTYILLLLLSAISGVIAYQLYVATTQMLLLPFVTPPFDVGPCFPQSKPHSAHLLGFFIAPLLFDTVVTVMTLIKALNIRRLSGGPNSRLIQTFLREGVFYYLLISIANLINGISYLQPRQVISAINIPLSVMLGPVLACRLILDLRVRGSETVTHSETGIAFGTKSGTQTSPHGVSAGLPTHRSRTFSPHFVNPHRTMTTNSSNVVLNASQTDPDVDSERDVVEMDDLSLGLGLHLEKIQAVKEDDRAHSTGTQSNSGTPAPAYSLEMGSLSPRHHHSNQSMDCVSGIRVDVEKFTSTL